MYQTISWPGQFAMQPEESEEIILLVRAKLLFLYESGHELSRHIQSANL